MVSLSQSGGGTDKRPTLIATVTTTQDVPSVEITQTDNGIPLEKLNISNFRVLIKFIKWVETTNYNYFTVNINDKSPLNTNLGISAINQIYCIEGEFTSEGRINTVFFGSNGQQGNIGANYYNFTNNWMHNTDERSLPIYPENEILKSVKIHHSNASGLLAAGLQMALYAYV